MKIFVSILLLMSIIKSSVAQSVGIGTSSPRPSAQLDVSSSNKGMLIPRMTSTQRKAISNPEFGLMVFDTEKGSIMFFDGQKWRGLSFTDENATTEIVRNASDPKESASYGSKVAMSGDYSIVGAPKYQGGTVAVPLNNTGAAYILYKGNSGWVQQAKLLPPDSTANLFFGGAVAISGDYAVVAAVNKAVNSVLYTGKIYVYKRNGTSWPLDTVFTKPIPAIYDYFGWSVAVSATAGGGPVVAVGIPNSDAGGTDRGEVYTYKRNTNNTWSFIQSVIPADLVNQDKFGYTVVMDGDYLAVGAPFQDYNANADVGAVYIYVYGGAVFTLQQKIPGPIAAPEYAEAQFGSSIALDGNRLVISYPWQVAFTNTTAAVRIYTRTAATWTYIHNIYLNNYETQGGPSISARSFVFGLGLALRGNDLLIAASGGQELPNGVTNSYSNVKGSVYHYRIYSGNTFSRVKTIITQAGIAGDLFGSSIGLYNGRYIIGNPKAPINNLPGSGSVLFGDVGGN